MIEVDPNTLGEASKALLWVIGLLVTGGGGYLVGRKQKVQLEPNAVEVSPSLCARQLKDNADDHANIFLRLNDLGQRVSSLEASLPQIRDALTRIDGKVDNILMRGLSND